jgi:hypothetical protein
MKIYLHKSLVGKIDYLTAKNAIVTQTPIHGAEISVNGNEAAIMPSGEDINLFAELTDEYIELKKPGK